MQYTEKIQQFQGFIVAEMPRGRGPDTSLWSSGLLVLSARATRRRGEIRTLHVHAGGALGRQKTTVGTARVEASPPDPEHGRRRGAKALAAGRRNVLND